MSKKYAYLIKVEPGANNNKFYEMKENGDGTFTAEYGRVEGTPQKATYPMSQWDKKFNEKLSSRKGYTDHTALHSIVETVQTKNSKGVSIIDPDKDVADIITKLQEYAQAQSAKVYNVKAAAVTKAQIDKAQEHLDLMSYSFKNHFGSKFDINMFNAELVKFFMVIPRKMKNVADHLITKNTTKAELEKLIEDEQSNLDTMASQVVSNTASDSDTADSPNATLLSSLGMKMKLVTDNKTINMVKDKAQEHGRQVLRIYEVVNEATQKEFDANLKNASNKKTDLLWHGSRNQNWWWIVQQGLKIRPSGAIHTGSMFGDGIYFASEANKSWGYTDGGRWTGGHNSSGKFHMALYEVHLGKQYCIESSDSSLSASKLKSKGDYDSTWGQKGRSLMRHEYIIYRSCQSTIKYLIEFKC